MVVFCCFVPFPWNRSEDFQDIFPESVDGKLIMYPYYIQVEVNQSRILDQEQSRGRMEERGRREKEE